MRITLARAHWRGRLRAPVGVLALAVLAACGGGDDDATDTLTHRDAVRACPALAGQTVPASAIGLPTQGAQVTQATLRPADPATGQPAYCEVRGSIAAQGKDDPPIQFALNLPTTWNHKLVQFGGGGFNGSVVTGLGRAPGGPADVPTPLALGYATFGSDSGHTGVGFDGSFGLNAQALANYSGESVKRTLDAARHVLRTYYQQAPRRVYHVGGSKGGHEGLVAAQRYGSDYDGVVAFYPASQNQAMVLSWQRLWAAAYETPGGALDPQAQALLRTEVLATCDALDGLTDGVVSNTQACRQTFVPESLQCAPGVAAGATCLSATQIQTLRTAATPLVFPFALAHGVQEIGPYPVFEGGDVSGTWFDPAGLDGTRTSYYGFNDAVIRYFIQQDEASRSAGFDYRHWQPRITALSAQYDASDPNLDAFRANGGRLILVQGTTDMLVSHDTTSAYYEQVRQRYGAPVAELVRYYVQPGYGHGGGAFTLAWDALAALDEWVEHGQAPAQPVATDASAATAGRTLPLCEYPNYPHYQGSGNPAQASSFACTPP